MFLRRKRLLTLSGASSAPPSRVQTTPKAGGTASSVPLTFATPPTVGNAIVVPLSIWIESKVIAVTDNRGNAYQLAASQIVQAGDIRTGIWFCPAITSTGSPFIVTVSITTGTFYLTGAIEVVGKLAVDQIASQAGGGAATSTKSTGLTPPLTANNIFVVAALGVRNGLASLVADAGWNQEWEELNGANQPGEVDTKILSGAAGTTIGCNWTLGTTSYGPSQLVAFKRG